MRRWATVSLSIALWLGLASVAFAQGNRQGQSTLHIVQRHETLPLIAAQYKTSVEAIAQTNGLGDPTAIEVGQRLIIPSGVVNATVPTAIHHAVQPGDTLASIARHYGTTEDQLAALNSVVNPDRLFVGQILNVGEAMPGRPPAPNGYVHTVQGSETLYGIALRYGVALNAIMTANDLTQPTLLYPGQRLFIPGPESAPALVELPPPLAGFAIAPLPAEVGRTIRIRLTSPQPISIEGTFINRPLRFSLEPDQITYHAFYGIHAFTVPGLYPLTLTVHDAQGNITTLTEQVYVADGRYASEVITLEADRQNLLDPAIVEAERARVAEIMSGYSPQRHFEGQMALPAAAAVTSPFGVRRSYNDGPYDTFHTGADFGGPPGAPVYAPAPGTVVLAEMLQVRGLLTILDHGWGVYTAYFHQEQSYVQVGQFVTTGSVIGTIGDTGRSTGPHLHWEMWVNGVEVDPLQWVRVSFP